MTHHRLFTFLLALALAFAVPPAGAQDRLALEKPGSKEPLETTAVRLDNGNEVHFFNLDDPGVQGTLLLESLEAGKPSALSALEDVLGEKLDPTEVFWALSEPGTPVPELFSPPSESAAKKLQPSRLAMEQGWARELLALHSEEGSFDKAPDLACNNDWFKSLVPNRSGWTGSTRLDRTRDNYPSEFTSDCIPVDGNCAGYGPRYRYEITTGNSTYEWKGAICGRAINDAITSHYGTPYGYSGPEVSFLYNYGGSWRHMRDSNTGGWSGPFEIMANSTQAYVWHWITSSKLKFRLQVRYAMRRDQFDLRYRYDL